MEKYSERFNDIVILQLDVEGFDKLSEKQKKLAYHLSHAGLWGRAISIDQGSKYNLPLFNNLISLHEVLDKESSLYQQVHDSLFIMFAHNGIYHSTSGEKLSLPLELNTLESFKDTEPQLVDNIKSLWFSNPIAQFRTVQTDGVDVVQASGGNFYENITTEEVNNYRKKHYPVIEGNEVPPFGFNEKLSKNEEGIIQKEIISENGLYGNYVKEINAHLNQALLYAENENQFNSINTLITFYKTGEAADFDKHCVAWTQDKDSDIYFINGLIESYEDPLGIGCTFESIIAFKNPLQTAKVKKIIDNIQWLENNLPFSSVFKKDKAVGLSASSINVISMAGDTAPSLPLGINLPNSDWIRNKHGSKSVSLGNVSAARSSYEVALREALFLPKYHSVLEQYGTLTTNLQVDLHEIAGHGSGKILDGVNTESLGPYYSVIEECRADLVALYYLADSKLKEFGIYSDNVNLKEAALAQYVSYLTNGTFGQLRRVDLGNDLTQAHFRNRQLISLWMLDHCDKSKVELVEENGKHYIEVKDVFYVHVMFGVLLEKIQTMKSTGDLKAAREIVMKYGTKVDQNIHKELLDRISTIDMPKVVGFNTPMLINDNNEIHLEQSTNFFEQQMNLHKNYIINSLEKKKTLKI